MRGWGARWGQVGSTKLVEPCKLVYLEEKASLEVQMSHLSWEGAAPMPPSHLPSTRVTIITLEKNLGNLSYCSLLPSLHHSLCLPPPPAKNLRGPALPDATFTPSACRVSLGLRVLLNPLGQVLTQYCPQQALTLLILSPSQGGHHLGTVSEFFCAQG